ncbi:uncharacterized protein LDX57_005081 [Aspergillus melleus]|uniref:uncharacterized protein n=1 Tax=Aspergillus melleus TaxID=138277 RepID=UPI001E8CAD48|nr:uncharacterized protein LDX57_005081 [Aspergillus melleus]KAH8427368.1 hypothetical protein LDX57_005081 [Aspergillus melleus]
MAQIYYTRPTPLLTTFTIITVLFGLSALIAWMILGLQNTAGIALFAISSLAHCMNLLLDPETTYKTTRVLEDGTTVRVKRPLVGFKANETEVGVTGGYEVRVDGWRYEHALVRL